MAREIPIGKILFWFVLVFILIGVGVLLFSKIFYPAYLSVANVCFFDEGELTERGYFVAGQTALNISKEGEREIIVTFTVGNERTLRHELCHSKQALARRFYGCDHIVLKYCNELECYTKQYLPLYKEEIEAIMSGVTE